MTVELRSCKQRTNRRSTTSAVAIVGRAVNVGLLADAHLLKTLIPAPDDLADTNGEDEWLLAVNGGVELLAVGFVQPASIVNGNPVTRLQANKRVGIKS